jgi:hypothetical protein
MLTTPLFLATILVTLVLRCTTTFAENDRPGKDVVRIGGDVTVEEGRAVKDAVAIGGSVTVDSGARVTGNAVAIGGDVHLKTQAHVEGDAVAIGGDILKEEGSSLGGSEVAILSGAKQFVPAFWTWSLLDIVYSSYIASLMLHITLVLIIAALGILLLIFVPGPVQIISATIRESTLKSAGWGVSSCVAIILVLVFTAGSLLGIVLVPILVMAVMVVALLGCVASGVFIGERAVSASAGTLMKPFLIGMLILAAIGLVPLVGGLVFLAANLFGFGAVLLSRFGRVQPPATGSL